MTTSQEQRLVAPGGLPHPPEGRHRSVAPGVRTSRGRVAGCGCFSPSTPATPRPIASSIFAWMISKRVAEEFGVMVEQMPWGREVRLRDVVERLLRREDWLRCLSRPGDEPGHAARFMDRDRIRPRGAGPGHRRCRARELNTIAAA